MSIEVLKEMKDDLVKCVHSQMDHLENVDTKELGEAVDMIKDFSEAIYYCTITESMEKAEKEQEERPAQVRNINYYTPMPMYYPGGQGGGNQGGSNSSGNSGGSSGGNSGSSSGGSRGGSRYYTPMMYMPDEYMPYGMMPDNDYYRRWEIAERNPKEGRSPVRRRMYMEGKEQHKDIPSQLHELEAYLQELSSDVTEMMKDASPEEKNTLRQKMTNLANKIV